MNKTNNKKLTTISQTLCRNMTAEERHLWYDFLKTLPVTVHRQKVIGNYVVDFYCAAIKTVIEIDGSQHYLKKGIESDKERDEYLSRLGIKVLRYSNLDIRRNFKGMCEDIKNRLLLEEKGDRVSGG